MMRYIVRLDILPFFLWKVSSIWKICWMNMIMWKMFLLNLGISSLDNFGQMSKEEVWMDSNILSIRNLDGSMQTKHKAFSLQKLLCFLELTWCIPLDVAFNLMKSESVSGHVSASIIINLFLIVYLIHVPPIHAIYSSAN